MQLRPIPVPCSHLPCLKHMHAAMQPGSKSSGEESDDIRALIRQLRRAQDRSVHEPDLEITVTAFKGSRAHVTRPVEEK